MIGTKSVRLRRPVMQRRVVGIATTLSEADRRFVAAWAADCAERVLGLFEAEAPDDGRPRALIARNRAFARGELNTAEEIRRRFDGGVGARDVKAPAAMAAARAVGQAAAVCHMGATHWVPPLMQRKPPAWETRTRQTPSSAKSGGSLTTCRPRFASPWELCRPSVRTRPVPLGPDSSLQANSASSFVSCNSVSHKRLGLTRSQDPTPSGSDGTALQDVQCPTLPAYRGRAPTVPPVTSRSNE